MVDPEDARLLSLVRSEGPVSSSTECLDYCEERSFDVAGIQNGFECWCGNRLTLADAEQPSSREVIQQECSTPCSHSVPGDICGGPWRTLLFGRNGVLDQYGFGSTKHGIFLDDEHSTVSSISDTSSRNATAASLPTDIVNDQPSHSASSPNPNEVTGKKVIAHHMVGNTYPYTIESWITDVTAAKSAGIDGFALNFGSIHGGWEQKSISDAFVAASTVGGFGMIFSFDMTGLPCSSQKDAQTLREFLLTWGPHPGHLVLPPASGSAFQRVVVSTFSGEWCNFGLGSPREGWMSVVADQAVVSRLRAAGREIAFVPSWFERVDQRKQEFNGVVQGDFHWNGGWPTGNFDVNWDGDAYRIATSPGPLFMASVSPGFFTHYGPNSYNKNWIYRSDDWLYASRWEMLVGHRAEVDLVEIVTWNDYGESSYIGPIEGEQPNSEAWTNGFPHLGFLDMTSYYATAFKTGSYPTITEDKVYLWSRSHPRDAQAPRDPIGRPNNADWTEDYVWGLVIAASDGELVLSCGSNSETFSIITGVNKVKIRNSPGQMRGVLRRADLPVVDVNPGAAFTYTLDPPSYNFNYFVASN